MLKSALRQFKTRTLTRDLAIGLALTVAIVLLGIGAVNYALTVTKMEKDLAVQSRVLAEKLSSILSLPIWALDSDAVEQIADAYQNAENVTAIRVLDHAGNMLHGRSAPTGYQLVSAQKPIYYAGQLIGSVEVALSTESIVAVKRNILTTTLSTVFLVVIVELVAISWLLQKFLNRPLAQLTEGINSIAGGHYARELGRAPQAEIDGIVQQVNDMARQIAEREDALRQSEERFRQVVASISDHVYLTELTASGEWINRFKSPNLEKLVKYPIKKFTDDWVFWLTDVMYPDDLPNALAQVARLERGEASETEYRLRRADGEIIWVRDSARVEQKGYSKLIYGVISDITERKQAEAEIHRLNAELEERVQQRTAELQLLNHELESFSYSVSHDLRAPLRAINGFSHILQNEYASQLPQPGLEMLNLVRASAERMNQLIEDLLRFSRSSRQPLNIQTVQTLAVVQHSLEILQAEQGGRQVEVIIGDLPPCQADPSLLLQVWTNLLSNAFKYTGKRQMAWVEVGSEPGENGYIYFVKDNGVGFDMRYADRLFGVFQRLHNEAEFEGTGVGLALVQRIIQRHGGRIWAESQPDIGAAFYFFLPGSPGGKF